MLAVEVDEGQHKAKSYHEDVYARYNDLAIEAHVVHFQRRVDIVKSTIDPRVRTF